MGAHRLSFGIQDPCLETGDQGSGAGLAGDGCDFPVATRLQCLAPSPRSLFPDPQGFEPAVRSRAFRLAKPGAIERHRFSLKANGDPDWERELWNSALAVRRTARERHVGELEAHVQSLVRNSERA